MNNKVDFLKVARKFIFLVVFNIIVFLTVESYTSTFWVSYGFIHFAYLMLSITSAINPKTQNSAVLGYPLSFISYVYFILTFILGAIFIIFRISSFTYAFILQIIITGLYGGIYISNIIANEKTISSEQVNIQDILYIKNATSELNLLLPQVSDTDLKKKLEKLYDSVRSSQVKSHASLAEIEKRIMFMIEDLKYKICLENYSEVNSLINDITNLLSERNSKIKMLR